TSDRQEEETEQHPYEERVVGREAEEVPLQVFLALLLCSSRHQRPVFCSMVRTSASSASRVVAAPESLALRSARSVSPTATPGCTPSAMTSSPRSTGFT